MSLSASLFVYVYETDRQTGSKTKLKSSWKGKEYDVNTRPCIKISRNSNNINIKNKRDTVTIT